MAFQAVPHGFLGLALTVLAWGLAWIVYISGPRRAANRFLAVGLFLEGATLGALRVKALTDSLVVDRGLNGIEFYALPFIPCLYLLFIGAALPVPWLRFLRTTTVRTVVLAFASLLATLRFVVPEAYLGEYVEVTDPFGYPTLRGSPGAFEGPFLLALAGVLLFGLVAAVAAYRRAPNRWARLRARAYLVAFGFRDITGGTGLIVFVAVNGDAGASTLDYFIAFWILPVVEIVFMLLVTYGILKVQLLDIDLKVRFAIKSGTLAAAFVAVFLIVAQVAEAVAQRYVGNVGWLLGAVAAGLLLFALTPLQRIAERVAHRAVPHARRIDEMALDERLDFYREQARIAWEDGALHRKERALLIGLRTRLGIPASDAERVELEVAPAT